MFLRRLTPYLDCLAMCSAIMTAIKYIMGAVSHFAGTIVWIDKFKFYKFKCDPGLLYGCFTLYSYRLNSYERKAGKRIISFSLGEFRFINWPYRELIVCV